MVGVAAGSFFSCWGILVVAVVVVISVAERREGEVVGWVTD